MEQSTKQPVKSISSEKPYDLDPNVEAALSYLITPITGIVVFLLEKNNKFVRFHAFQSILFGVALFIFWNLAIALVPFLFGFLRPFMAIGVFILWLLLIWKAYNKEEWELPLIGKIAHDQANK